MNMDYVPSHVCVQDVCLYTWRPTEDTKCPAHHSRTYSLEIGSFTNL